MSFRSYVFSAALAFVMGGATLTVMQPAAYAQTQQALPADLDAALVASSGSINDLSTAAAQLIATNPTLAAQIIERAIELRPDVALQVTAIGAQILPEQAAGIAAAAASAAPAAAAGIATIAATAAPGEASAITAAVANVIQGNGVDAVAEVIAGVSTVVPEASQELVSATAGNTGFSSGQITEALLDVSSEDVQEIVNEASSAMGDVASILSELKKNLDDINLPEPNSNAGSGS